MRFSPLFISTAVVSFLAAGAQIQSQNRAVAQLAPSSSGVLGGPIQNDLEARSEKREARTSPTSRPFAAPTPTPVPLWKPRFGGQRPLRVGLSTAGGVIAVYFPDGATLFNLPNPTPTKIKAGDTASFTSEPSGGMAKEKVARSISARTSEGELIGLRRVYLAVNGRPARVTSNGKNAKYGRPYRGDLEIFPQKLADPVKRKGPLALVNVVPLEAYLKGVVPWEMSPSAPLEALKAQAICARTKTLDFVQSKRFAAGDFEICDYDACQGYPGTENEKPATTQAVEATKGLALYQNGRPIDAVYSTNSGGITANARDVWKGDAPIPYLQSVPDFPASSPIAKLWKDGMTEAEWTQFCIQDWPSYAQPKGSTASPYEARRYRWNQVVSVEEATKAFAADGIARVTQLQVVERAASGRIRRLRVTGLAKMAPLKIPIPAPNEDFTPVDYAVEKSVDLEGDGKIRAMFSKRLGSTTALPSSLFTISPLADASGQVTGWNLQGAGWGHGVGMCQRGAQNHALEGWDARRILHWYYRGVEIRNIN